MTEPSDDQKRRAYETITNAFGITSRWVARELVNLVIRRYKANQHKQHLKFDRDDIATQLSNVAPGTIKERRSHWSEEQLADIEKLIPYKVDRDTYDVDPRRNQHYVELLDILFPEASSSGHAGASGDADEDEITEQ